MSPERLVPESPEASTRQGALSDGLVLHNTADRPEEAMPPERDVALEHVTSLRLGMLVRAHEMAQVREAQERANGSDEPENQTKT